MAEKRRIAVAAVDQFGPAETIFIDEGFTPQLVAEELARSGRPATVVTASSRRRRGAEPVERDRGDPAGRPGARRTLGTVDHWATAMLSEFVIDLAVLGANGITRDRGLTVPNTAVAAVKAKAMEVSRRRMFVGIHTKFGITSFCRFADVPDFETLITDTVLSTHEAHRFSAMGPQVLRV